MLMRNKIGGGALRVGFGFGRALCIVGKVDRFWLERFGFLFYFCYLFFEVG